MLALCPFTRPFTFGTDACHTKTGTHVGTVPNAADDGPVLGTMLGNREFMVLADSTFIILTPSSTKAMTLHEALFPNSGSHTILFGRKGQSYQMQPGCIILAQSDLTLRSATVILADRNQYNRLLYQSLQWSLIHFGTIHRRIVLVPDRAEHPLFVKNPTKPLHLSSEWGSISCNSHHIAELKRVPLIGGAVQDDTHHQRRTAAAALLDFSLAVAAQQVYAGAEEGGRDGQDRRVVEKKRRT